MKKSHSHVTGQVPTFLKALARNWYSSERNCHGNPNVCFGLNKCQFVWCEQEVTCFQNLRQKQPYSNVQFEHISHEYTQTQTFYEAVRIPKVFVRTGNYEWKEDASFCRNPRWVPDDFSCTFPHQAWLCGKIKI